MRPSALIGFLSLICSKLWLTCSAYSVMGDNILSSINSCSRIKEYPNLTAHIKNKVRHKAIPPLKDIEGTDLIPVSVTAFLDIILGIDESDDIIRVKVLLTFGWQDDSFKWPRDRYCGINYVIVDAADAGWTPKVSVANMLHEDSLNVPRVSIKNTGEMGLMTSSIYKLSCPFDMQFYPFDVQSCFLRLWFTEYIDITEFGHIYPMKLDFYTENTIWTLLATTYTKKFDAYWPYMDNYVNDYSVKYSFLLRRQPDFYVFSVLVPIVCLSNMGSIMFIIPCQSPAKTNVSLSLILSFFVYFSMLEQMLPPRSVNQPIICLYIMSTFVILLLFAFYSAFLQWLSHRSKMPRLWKRRDRHPRQVANRLSFYGFCFHILIQMSINTWMAVSYQQMPQPMLLPNNTVAWKDYIFHNKTGDFVL